MWKLLLWLLAASKELHIQLSSMEGLHSSLVAPQQSVHHHLVLQEPPIAPKPSEAPIKRAIQHLQHLGQPIEHVTRPKETHRRLQDAETAEVTVVRTAEQLLDAFVNGAEHIQLQEHLDLTVLNGNCTKAAPTAEALGFPSDQAPLREFTPQQCLLLTRYDFPSGTHNIWLDKLYIRSATSLTGSFGELLEVWGSDAQLWMTQVTLQGSGDGTESCEDCGLDVWERAAVYAEGVRVLRAFAGAAVSLVRCTFMNNTLFPSDFGAAIIQADGDDRYGTSQVRLQGCSFSGNTPPTLPVLLADNRDDNNARAEFYSDSSEPQVCVYEGLDDSSAPPPCMMVAPSGLGDSKTAFLDSKNPWLQQVQEEVESPTTRVRVSQSTLAVPPGGLGASVAAARAPGSNATSAITEKEGVGAAVFAVVAIAAALLLLTIAGLLLTLRKRQHEMTPEAAEALRAYQRQKLSSRDTRRMSSQPPCSSVHGRHARSTQHACCGGDPTIPPALVVRTAAPNTQNASTDTRNDDRADSDVIRNVSHGRTVTFTVKSASHISTAQRHSSLGRAWDLKSGGSDRRESDTAPDHPKSPESGRNSFSHRERISAEPLDSVVAQAVNRKASGDVELDMHAADMHEQGPSSNSPKGRAETAVGDQKASFATQNSVSQLGKKRARSRLDPTDLSVVKSSDQNSLISSGRHENAAKNVSKDFEPAAPYVRRPSSSMDEVTISNPYAETSSSNLRGTSSFCDPSKPRSFRSLSRASGRVSGTEASLKHLAAAAQTNIRQSSPHAWQSSGPEATVTAGVRSRMHAPRHMLHTDPMHATSPVGRDEVRTANSEPGIADYAPPVDTACAAHEADDEEHTIAYETALTSSDSLNLLYGTALLASGSTIADRGVSGEEQSDPAMRAPRVFDAPVFRKLPEASTAAHASTPPETPQHPPEVGLSRSAVEVSAVADSGNIYGSGSDDQSIAHAAHAAQSNAACYIRLSDPGRSSGRTNSGVLGARKTKDDPPETSNSTVAAPEATFAALAGTMDTRAGSSSAGDTSHSPAGRRGVTAAASPFDRGLAGGSGGGVVVPTTAGTTGSVSTLDLMGLSEGIKDPPSPSAHERETYVTSNTNNTYNTNDTDKHTIFSSYDAESERDAQGRVTSRRADSPQNVLEENVPTVLDAVAFQEEPVCNLEEQAQGERLEDNEEQDSDEAVQGSHSEDSGGHQQQKQQQQQFNLDLRPDLDSKQPQTVSTGIDGGMQDRHEHAAAKLTIKPIKTSVLPSAAAATRSAKGFAPFASFAPEARAAAAAATAAAATSGAAQQHLEALNPLEDDQLYGDDQVYGDGETDTVQHGLVPTDLQSVDFQSTTASAAEPLQIDALLPDTPTATEAANVKGVIAPATLNGDIDTIDTAAVDVHDIDASLNTSPNTNTNTDSNANRSSSSPGQPTCGEIEGTEADGQEDIGRDQETARERLKTGDVFSESDEGSLSQWTFELPLLQPSSLEQVSLKLEDVHEPRTEPPKKPRSRAPTGEWLEYIQQQLDGYGPTPLLLNRYELLGPQHRCCGSQGVVQYARRVQNNAAHLYAIKFYARVRTFQEESEIYKSSPLRRFMPTVSRVERNEDGAIKDPFGKPLAPFVVMEKGESLQEKLGKRNIDVYMAAQVLGHISQRLAELHDAGFVHRDLKPGNIMWQPRTCAWVLIDFGLAARISRTARVGCTPPYAAPETASSLQRRQRTTTAAAAVDVWSLGVIAFEMLLQRPAFGPFVSVDQIFERLIDSSQPLPWEEGCITLEEKQKLGKFRKPLLKLLKRRPAERATAKDFCKQMAAIFSSSPRASTFRGATPMRW